MDADGSRVDALELLEVQLANSTAPFILISRLRPSMAASSARHKCGECMSAMERAGQSAVQGAGHPHTNMAKAALNMLTRIQRLMLSVPDGILATAIDTGWITGERPHPTKVRPSLRKASTRPLIWSMLLLVSMTLLSAEKTAGTCSAILPQDFETVTVVTVCSPRAQGKVQTLGLMAGPPTWRRLR